jgi:hypothetical protein
MNLQRVFRDNRTGPDTIHQLVFGDKFAGRSGENFDDLEGAPAYRHDGPEDPEFATGKVDLALTRGMDQPNALLRHASGPRGGLL